jgi:hypothetical protein
MNYNIDDIKTNLKSVTGFANSLDPSFPDLSTDLTTASSGTIINDGSIPFITLENIKSLGINDNLFEFSEYNASTTYAIGNRIKYTYPTYASGATYNTNELVYYSGVGYKSLIDTNLGNQPDENLDKWEVQENIFSIYDALTISTNKQPDLNTADWSEINIFNLFLETRLQNSIANVVQKCTSNYNNILEQKTLYYGIGDGTVTFRFSFIRNANIKLKINRIGLHFTEAVTDLTFSVYNQNTLITTFTGSTTDNNFVWVDVADLELDTEKAGEWFILYDQDDLGAAKAINNELDIKSNVSNFVQINQIEVASGTDLKTVSQNDFVYYQSNIANIDYTILPDLTNWITLNKYIFAEAIKYQFCIDIYKMFITNDNVRSNRNERNIDLDLLKSNVYSTDETSETLIKKYNKVIHELRKSIGRAKIDNINLPNNGFFLTHGLNI